MDFVSADEVLQRLKSLKGIRIQIIFGHTVADFAWLVVALPGYLVYPIGCPLHSSKTLGCRQRALQICYKWRNTNYVNLFSVGIKPSKGSWKKISPIFTVIRAAADSRTFQYWFKAGMHYISLKTHRHCHHNKHFLVPDFRQHKSWWSSIEVAKVVAVLSHIHRDPSSVV